MSEPEVPGSPVLEPKLRDSRFKSCLGTRIVAALRSGGLLKKTVQILHATVTRLISDPDVCPVPLD